MAKDEINASATYWFVVDITNEAPEILGSLLAITAYDDISFNNTVNFSDYFRENDLDQTLHFSVTSLPGFISTTK